jgi:hypothetical protein
MALTDEQYEELLKQENNFDTLVNHGWTRNLNYPFLEKMKGIYQDVIGGTPLNINCSACISSAMHRLWPLMQLKRAEYIKRAEDKVIAETIRKRDEVAALKKKK